MEIKDLQVTELYPPMAEGWFYAMWGGYAKPSALSMSLLRDAAVIKITVLLPEQLN